MKTQKLFLFAILLMVLAWPQSLRAYDFSAVAPSGDTLYYNIISGGVSVTYPGTSSNRWSGFSAPTGSLTIPSTVTNGGNTYSVTSIDYHAFDRCRNLTSVTIPNSVTTIGQYAFWGCNNLTSVTIGNSVTSIGSCVFYGCTSLTSVTIPNSVTFIDNSAFRGCTSLTSVTIPNSVTTIDRNAFLGCNNLTSVTIGNSVTSIGSSAFSGCTNLTSVTIPNSVTSIGNSAFSNCTSLTMVNYNASNCSSMGNNTYPVFSACTNLATLNIGDSVTNIPAHAFNGCTSLTSVTIPNSVTSIGYNAFCNIKHIEYHGSALGSPWGAISMNGVVDGDFIFSDNSRTNLLAYLGSGEDVTIPSTVTSIGDRAFYGCRSITSLTIPNSVTSIGQSAFFNCDGLSNVTIPNSVTSIGYYAFGNVKHIEYHGTATGSPWEAISMNGVTDGDFVYSDSSRTNLLAYIGSGGAVTIPSTVTSIDDQAFYHCRNLTSVTIPNSVTTINQYAFLGCNNLTSVTIGNSVTSIGNYAFGSCTNLTSVIIGNSVTTISSYAFSYCTSLTSVIIGNSVTTIGYGAFLYCTNLVSVTIPNSVTIIYSGAFSYCTSLTYVIVQNDNPPSIFSDAFEYLHSPCSLIVPCQSDSLYRARFWGTGIFSYFSYIVEDCSDTISPYYDFWSVSPSGDTLYYIILDSNSVTVVHPFYSDTTEQAWWDGAVQPTGTLTIPATVTYNDTTYTVVRISEHAFYNCTNLTSVTIPNTVDSIGEWAFAYSTNLGSVTLGNAVTTIGYGAFYGCTGLSLLVIPDSLTTIGSHAFSIPNCHVSAVSIPNTVTTIGDHAFSGWGDLTTLTIPRSVTYIGDWAFAACTSLATVNFYADSCTYMGSTTAPVFDNDINIQALHIGNTVKTIPANAFYGCSGIGTVTIPASVSSIGSHAFAGCSGLTSITAKRAVAPVAGANAFDNIPASTPVYIPCGSTASYASRWSHFTNFVEVMDAHVWVRASDAAMGSASVTVQPTCAAPTATIVATPNVGYLFALWSDGDTLNPRTLTIDRDTLLTALFVPVPDTVVNYDTIVVHDTILIHDTTIVNNYIHDTTIVHDTTIIHDTTFVDVYVHDTTIVHDTAFVEIYIHDTTVVNNYIHDTTIVHDTTYIDVYVHDTTIVHDTTYIDNYIHDTITVVMPIDYHTLTLISAQPTMGIVVGSGTYSDSTEVEIAAVAICGYHFVQWSDGNTESPRRLTVTEDMELTATFVSDEVGITDVPSPDANIMVQDNVITVRGAEGKRVRIFDSVGRLLSTAQTASEVQHFRMTVAGVYLVQVGDGTAQRVVVGITR